MGNSLIIHPETIFNVLTIGAVLGAVTVSGSTPTCRYDVGVARPEGRGISMAYTRRVGISLCVHGDKLYQWRGDTAFIRSNLTFNVDMFDYISGKWSTEMTTFTNDISDFPTAITGSSLVGYGNSLYLFGGFGTLDLEKYFKGLHQLDLMTMKWKRFVSSGHYIDGPMAKYLCGMTTLEEGLLVFGGFGLAGANRQKGALYDWSTEFHAMWTNELHLFDLCQLKWVAKETTGIRPSPCAAASFNLIDKSRILLFGGRQLHKRVNEIHILDINHWQWSGAIVQSSPLEPWPVERSLHTAVCLVDPRYVNSPSDRRGKLSEGDSTYPLLTKQRLLVIWGQDSNDDPITDTWILHTDTMSWLKWSNLFPWDGRKWHSSCTYYPTPYETLIVTCGGFTKKETDPTLLEMDEFDKDTFYVKTGVSSLYQLCLSFVHSNSDMLNQLESLLPKHIQRHVQEVADISEQYKSLGLYRLNI